MKKIFLTALLVPALALGQTYPSPTFNSLTLQNPLAPANGGTGVANSSTITLGGNLTTSGANALTFATTGSTNITLPTSGTLLGTANSTGTGAAVLATSPTLTTPNLGTPSVVTLTNGTGLPIATGLSGLGTGVASALGSAVTGSGGLISAAGVAGTYAPLASAALTGTPTAPTAPTGTSTTQLATTAFVANHLAPCPSILDHGGDNTGTNDNTTAYANTIAASPSGQACVYFPAGTYAFASQAVYTLPSTTADITIIGAGSENTKLVWGSGQGLKINLVSPYNSVHIRDMAFLTGTTATGTALYLNQTAASILNPANTAVSDITNVTIRGSDTYAGTNYWQSGIVASGASNINFTGLNLVGSSAGLGTGVNVFGTSTVIPVQFNFQMCFFYNLAYGIIYGNYVQGVTVNQSNFVNNVGAAYGIYVPAGETNLAQLTVTASQFSVKSIAINALTNAPPTMLASNMFIVNDNGFGVQMASAGLYSIIGNSFFPENMSPVSTTGVDIVSSTAPGVISGNTFYKMSGNAVFLAAGSSAVNVQSNGYLTNGSNVTNNGTGNTVGNGSP